MYLCTTESYMMLTPSISKDKLPTSRGYRAHHVDLGTEHYLLVGTLLKTLSDSWKSRRS